MSMIRNTIIYVSLLQLFQFVKCGKILLVPITGSPLRSTLFYGKELSDRGHEITLLESGLILVICSYLLLAEFTFGPHKLAERRVDENDRF